MRIVAAACALHARCIEHDDDETGHAFSLSPSFASCGHPCGLFPEKTADLLHRGRRYPEPPRNLAHTFSASGLSRTATLYFTVTVFASVGFGDIVATTDISRTLVMVQMILDLIVLGAVIRIFIGAVQVARRGAPGGPEAS